MDIIDVIKRRQKLKIVHRLNKRYGEKFLLDMTRLHEQKEHTLSMVANRYGVSRQRISQIHQALFGLTLQDSKRTSDIQIGCKFDPRQRINMVKEKSNLYTHIMAKKIFFERVKSLGLPIRLSGFKYPDFIISTSDGDKNIIIKSCCKAKQYCKSSIIKYLRYNFKNQVDYDFVAMNHNDQKTFTIVPKDIIGEKKCVYVPVHTPIGVNAKNPYGKYLEAWGLLTSIKRKTT